MGIGTPFILVDCISYKEKGILGKKGGIIIADI